MKGIHILIYGYGTTALKTSLFDEKLNLIDWISTEVNYEYPCRGYVEIDAEILWQMTIDSTRKIIGRNNCGNTIEYISFTSQAETVIPVSSSGECTRKGIVWLDTRAEKENEALKQSINIDDFYSVTGLSQIEPIWPINKITWIKRNEGDIYKKTYKFLLLKDYIIFKMTGRMVTDPTISSYSAYLDLRNKKWWQRILDLNGIDMKKLPEIEGTDEIIGELSNDAATELGLSCRVKVINGMLDQCASVIGAGNVEPGTLTETTGTVLAMATAIDDIDTLDPKKRIPVVCHGIRGKYLVLTYCPTAGIVLKWFKDNFCEIEIQKARVTNENVYRILDNMVTLKSAINPDLILLPHFCGQTGPESNPYIRGVISGLSLDIVRSDILRAIMESIGFLLKENLDFLIDNSFYINEIISMGGGARSDVWLQIKSDILNKKVYTLENEESTSLGCAFIVALKVGLFSNFNDIRKINKYKKEYVPNTANLNIYTRKYELYRKLYQQVKGLYV